MLDETLACVQTYLDVDTMHPTVVGARDGSRPDAEQEETLLSVDLHTREGREVVEAFFRRQVPKLQGAPKLVRSFDGQLHGQARQRDVRPVERLRRTSPSAAR